jgi:hypothetical protein
VAVGLLVWDQWRTRRKESTRREGVEDRLDALEDHTRQIVALQSEVDRLKTKYEPLPSPAEGSDNSNKTDDSTTTSTETKAPTTSKDETRKSEEFPDKVRKSENTSLAEQSQ